MARAIQNMIVFLLSNFALACFLIALVLGTIAALRSPAPVTRRETVDRLLYWYLLVAIGVSYLINFVMHAFFGRMTAATIGWADSPFQLEVATASLGFSVAAFYAASRGFGARMTAILGPAVFMLGAAVGHVRQMIVAHDFAPGNAGSFFWIDILMPLAGLALLALSDRAPAGSGSLAR